MCAQTQAKKKKYLHGLSYQLPQFFPFLISAKESDGDISLPGSLYHAFKHEMAKQDLTEAFQ